MVKKALKPITSFAEAASAWDGLGVALGQPLSMKMTRSNADAMTSLVGKILDSNELSIDDPLVVFLMEWIGEFERQFVQIEPASPVEVLRHLMKTNDLRQADLADELGGQPVVSAILNGRRGINAGQAMRLARRFRVSPAIFIEDTKVARTASVGEFSTSEHQAAQSATRTTSIAMESGTARKRRSAPRTR
jgi:HTH-type transcriptional regulator/antitoxin HigA